MGQSVYLRASANNSAVIVTSSSRKDRLEGYLGVGDIDLSSDEVEAIDAAGIKGQKGKELREGFIKYTRLLVGAALGYYAICKIMY